MRKDERQAFERAIAMAQLNATHAATHKGRLECLARRDVLRELFAKLCDQDQRRLQRRKHHGDNGRFHDPIAS